jgi:phage tail-like protein
MRRQAIERLLPAAYQRAATEGSVLRALLDVMEGLHEPDERLLADVDVLFAPYTAPERFVPFLTGWVTLDYLVGVPRPGEPVRLPLPAGRVRDLIANGAALAKLRGTPIGLRWFLQIATGATGFVIDEPPQRPFHFIVRVPPEAAQYVAVINRIVEMEKPAASTFEIAGPEGSSAQAVEQAQQAREGDSTP